MRKGIMIGATIVIAIAITIVLFFTVGLNSDNNVKNPGNPDLETIKKDIQSNYLDISKISKEYYIRPEFYPNYDVYKNKTNRNQTASYGYGAYPGEVSYNAKGFKAEQYLDVYTFVHSSLDVGNFQGLGLSLKSPDDELFETFTDPSDILLSPVSLESPETTPNWTYRIKMRIVAKKDIPKGRYVFKLSAGQPSPEKQMEFSNMVNKYASGGNMVQPEKFFDFVLYAYN